MPETPGTAMRLGAGAIAMLAEQVSAITAEHHLNLNTKDADGNCLCACGIGVEDWDMHWAEVALAAVLPAHEAMVRASLSAELYERAMRYEPTSAFRRGLLAASRIIAPPITPDEIARAIRDGNVVGCPAPEDRIARGERP